MRIYILCCLAFMLNAVAFAQIGIGTTTPASSSVLDLTSTNKGLLLPRVPNTAAVTVPVNGLMIYDVSSNCLKVYQNGAWSDCLDKSSNSSSSSLASAACTGFLGNYCNSALSSTTYLVTLYNNDFSAKQFTPSTTDLTLSGITGLTVSAVSPNTTTTINAESSIQITYTISGTPSVTGTLTGTFSRLGANCSSTTTVIAPKAVTAASATTTLNVITHHLNPITHTTSGATTGIGTAIGFPLGVNATWTNNTITINGTPRTLGTYNYSIPLEGCGPAVNATGTITVGCGAYIAPNVSKVFMCHNLGADTSLDPNTPVQGILGSYYLWGYKNPVADAYTSAGPINGWVQVKGTNEAWSDNSKTANDPCPTGFRVPSTAQLLNIGANNYISASGTWTESDNNFGSATHLGTNNYRESSTLTLPAAGERNFDNGSLWFRGLYGKYWTTTGMDIIQTFSTHFNLDTYYKEPSSSTNYGRSIRCISE